MEAPCRLDEGLQGIAGFQFQAASAGVDQESQGIARALLLYEAPDRWMHERRPVAEYPRSFGHVSKDGVLATAKGFYLGKEATGNREGNHITHVVLTRNPQDYGPFRPAQFYWGRFWSQQKSPTKVCDQVDMEEQELPFGVDKARQFVLDQHDGQRMLVALLSAMQRLTDQKSRRIAFIASDPDAVLCWIAAATMLLPQEQALRISFKVFCVNPAYAEHHIIAIHPDFGTTPITVAQDHGRVVFDLVNGEYSQVEPTPSAVLWAQMFCEEDDPIDVMDMSEIAYASGLPPSTALVIGRVARKPDTISPEDAMIIIGWLRRAPCTLLTEDRKALVRSLIDRVPDWPHDVILGLDLIAQSGQIGKDDASATRLALISAEVDRAARGQATTWTPLSPLPPGWWMVSHQAQGEQIMHSALAMSTEPAQFDGLLRVAVRLSLNVDLDRKDISPQAERFISAWADHPEWTFQRVGWPATAGRRLVDGLEGALDALAQKGRDQWDRVGDLWWQYRLPQTTTIRNNVDMAVVAAAMRAKAEDTDARLELVGRYLTADDESVRNAVNSLWTRVDPTINELHLVAAHVPAGVLIPERVFHAFILHMLDSATVTGNEIALAQDLVRKRLVTSTELTELLDRHPEVSRQEPQRRRGFVSGLHNLIDRRAHDRPS